MTKRRPLEISVRAQLCTGDRYHSVGDLLTYHSALWMVKGLYLGASRPGEPELYYILSETSPSLDQVGEFERTSG